MPWWVAWASSLIPVLGAPLATWIGARLCVAWYARPLTRDPGAHWTERARHVSRLRLCVLLLGVMFAAGGLALGSMRTGVFSTVDASVTSLASVLLTTWVMTRELRRVEKLHGNPRLAAPRSARTRWVYGIAFASVPYLALALFCFLPSSPHGFVLAAAIAGTLLALATLCGVEILAFERAGWIDSKEPSELGVDVVDATGSHGRILVLERTDANAFAFVGLGRVAFTQPALEILSPAERSAVARHEWGHLNEPLRNHAARFLPGVVLLAVGWARPLSAHVPSIVQGVAVIVGLVLLIWNRRMSRRAEESADTHGAEESPADYARALEKLHEYNLVPVRNRVRSAHPDLYDRMIRAGVEPTWPRPDAPPGISWLAILVIVLVAMPTIVLVSSVRRPANASRERLERWVAFSRDPVALEWLAQHESRDGRFDRALVFYVAAAELRPTAAYPVACAAMMSANVGSCDEARAELAEAERRFAAANGPVHERESMEQARRVVSNCRDRTR